MWMFSRGAQPSFLVTKLLTVYEMWWNWVEKFIPFRFTSMGTYEQDASFGNKIFANVLKKRSFWASIKLIERPVLLLVWENANRYTDYEVMWSWEAKRQEWTDVTTNQGISDLTGGPQSWTDCRTHFSSGGFWTPPQPDLNYKLQKYEKVNSCCLKAT